VEGFAIHAQAPANAMAHAGITMVDLRQLSTKPIGSCGCMQD
jgi:hypothetical protein